MIRLSLSPTSRLLRGLAGWTLLGLVPATWPELTVWWLLAGILLVAMTLRDAAALRRRPPLAVERLVAPALPLGAWRPVRLRFENRQAQSATLTVFDHYPTAAADCADLPQTVTVEPGGWAELSYRPVSYTHLDVYKRQVIAGCCRRWRRDRCWIWGCGWGRAAARRWRCRYYAPPPPCTPAWRPLPKPEFRKSE